MEAEPTALPVGKGELLKEGTDVAIFAIGVTVWEAFKAAERLEREGISTAVVNGRFVKPLDTGLISDVVEKVRYVITVEEGARMGGFGTAVLEALSELGMTHLRTKVIGLPDWYIEQGPQDLLRERYGLTAEGIYESVKELLVQGTIETETPSARGKIAAASYTSKRETFGDEQGS